MRCASAGARVDGVLHAIAFAPEDAIGGKFMTAPAESATQAFQTSAFSLKALAGGAGAADAARSRASSASTSTPRVAWPIYDWMGVAKAALESVSRYLARDLGPQGIRVNLVSAGPLGTVAARGIPGFEQLAELWRAQAPLGWDIEDPGTGGARRSACCSRTTRARSPARSCTSTAAFTPSGRRRQT